MTIIRILLIGGLVYIALQQKKESTRNVILFVTGLIAFCMMGKEGFDLSYSPSTADQYHVHGLQGWPGVRTQGGPDAEGNFHPQIEGTIGTDESIFAFHLTEGTPLVLDGATELPANAITCTKALSTGGPIPGIVGYNPNRSTDASSWTRPIINPRCGLGASCSEAAPVSVAEDLASCAGVTALTDATACDAVITLADTGITDLIKACNYTPATPSCLNITDYLTCNDAHSQNPSSGTCAPGSAQDPIHCGPSKIYNPDSSGTSYSGTEGGENYKTQCCMTNPAAGGQHGDAGATQQCSSTASAPQCGPSKIYDTSTTASYSGAIGAGDYKTQCCMTDTSGGGGGATQPCSSTASAPQCGPSKIYDTSTTASYSGAIGAGDYISKCCTGPAEACCGNSLNDTYDPSAITGQLRFGDQVCCNNSMERRQSYLFSNRCSVSAAAAVTHSCS